MYVTYDETGALTGAYMQDVVPDHQGISIPVSQTDFDRWTSLQANAARIGLEVRPAPPAPSPAEQAAEALQDLQKAFTIEVQRRLDAFAEERNYDGIVSLCTYVTSGNPQFAAEAQRGVDLRDATWAAGYALMTAVQGGATAPITVADAIAAASLPPLTWES